MTQDKGAANVAVHQFQTVGSSLRASIRLAHSRPIFIGSLIHVDRLNAAAGAGVAGPLGAP